jgi:class 3 adenylate cyclase/pimeloyl-ACP methyl ester carboxylesterase
VSVPEVHYTRSGDVSIAYQVVGDGPMDVVFVRGTLADLLAAWDQPMFVEHVEGLASFARVILFDKRGSGLSDPVNELPTLENRMEDVRAVLDALGCEQATLWSAHEGARLAVLFAATYPERMNALVIYDPSARGLWAPDYPWAPSEEERAAELREIAERWGEREYLVERGRGYCPTRVDDERFLDWYVWYMRRSASPAEAVAFHRMAMDGDVRDVLPAVRAPTLVLHRSAARDEATDIASRIEGATLVEVPGLVDGYSWVDERANAFMLEETRRFVGGVGGPPLVDRVLATVLFTDIVSSTETAGELGDREWRRLLERHHKVVRRVLDRYRGREVATAGDGFLATFDGPARAVRAALAATEELRSLGLEIRAGVHTGEVEVVGSDVAGIAVHTGARVAALARPSEVLVSSTLKDLVAGSGIEFEERGEHELKGVPGTWSLYAVVGA